VQLVFILEQVLNGSWSGLLPFDRTRLSLIFALGGIVNLAHGGFYAIGAYLAVVLADVSGLGAPSLCAVAVGLIASRSSGCCFAASTARSDLEPAVDLSELAMGSTRPAHRVRRDSAAFSIRRAARQIFVGDFTYSRYVHHFAVAVAAVTAPGSSSIAPRRPLCARACRTPTWSRARHFARALHDGDRRARVGSPGLPACCSPDRGRAPAMGAKFSPRIVVVVIGAGLFWA